MNERRNNLVSSVFIAAGAVVSALCCVTYWRDYGLSIRAIPHAPFGEVIVISFLVFGTLFFSCIALWMVGEATKEER